MAYKPVTSLEDDGMDWQEKLKKYAMDNTSGQNEYARAMAKYNYQNSTGDTAGAAASKKWMGQVDTAMGGLMSKPTKPVDDAMSKYTAYMDKTMNRTPFDPANDQQYQAQLAAERAKAAQGAQTATNNAMVSLGSRGIGNSSVAVDRANQIQQSANNQLQTQITPQLIAQAYQRYMGEQQLGQQDLSNLGNYVNMVNGQQQQGLDNAYRDKTFDRSVLENDRNYGLNKSAQDAQMTGYYNPNADQIAKMNANSQAWFGASPDEQARLAAENQAIADNIGAKQDDAGNWIMPGSQQTASERQRQADNAYRDQTFDYTKQRDTVGDEHWNKQFSANQANVAADNARSQNAQNTSLLMDIWRNTGVAPAGIPGVAEGTPLASASSKQIANMDEEKRGLVDALRNGTMTPGDALKQIQEDQKFGFYTIGQAAELSGIIQSMAQSAPANEKTQLTKEQADSMPSDKQLDKLYKEQGNGAPLYEWKNWYVDPKGRVGGLSFSQWKQLYGPILRAK